MAGLFADPTQVGLDEQMALRLAGSQDPRAVVQGSIFNLGNSAGGALTRGLGGDSSTPAQKRAADLQRIAKQVDWKDPNSIYAGANAMNQAGYQAEAFKLMELLPNPTSSKVTAIGPKYLQKIEDKDNPGNYVYQWFQKYSDGSDKAEGAALPNETTTPPTPKVVAKGPKYLQKIEDQENPGNYVYQWFQKYSDGSDRAEGTALANEIPPKDGISKNVLPSVFDAPAYKDEETKLYVAKFSNLPEFKTLMNNLGVTPEQVEPYLGQIKDIAVQMKQEELARFAPAYERGDISAVEMNQIFGPLSHTRYFKEAYKQYLTSGAINKDIKPGVGADTPRIDPQANNTDLTDVLAGSAYEAKLTNEMNRVGMTPDGELTGLIVPDPNRNGGRGFRLTQMDVGNARNVFGQINSLDNAGMQKAFEQQGYVFTPEVLASHMQVWNVMRENPEVVQGYLQRMDAKEVTDSWKAKTIQDYAEGRNAHGVATAMKIFKYLGRVGSNIKKPGTAEMSLYPENY